MNPIKKITKMSLIAKLLIAQAVLSFVGVILMMTALRNCAKAAAETPCSDYANLPPALVPLRCQPK